MIDLTITKDAHDQRADRYLYKQFDVPKSVIQKWFRNKRVKRDRKALKASDRVYAGDTLQLYADAPVRKRETPVSAARTRPLTVVYENEHLLIMYKPPGQLSHAAHGREYGKNIVDAMIAHLIASGEYIPRQDAIFTPAIVNRLDRNTGGLLIGAKHYEALKELNRAMREREIRKFYRALTAGKALAPGVYEANLRTDAASRISTVGTEGKSVRLEILGSEPVGSFHLHTLELHTGRTHQIRAQLQNLGAPVAGDPKYGDAQINARLKPYGFYHQYLLAHALQFVSDAPLLSPLYGKKIELKPVALYARLLDAAGRL